MRIRLPLSWRTRNYVGTIFGDSMYGAVDPVHMVMLIKALGSEFVVWDKAACIRFLRPGRGTLYATFTLTDKDLAAVRSEAVRDGRTERVFTVDLIDAAGQACATCAKTLRVRWRPAAQVRGDG